MLLAAGLDTRSFRLAWPQGTRVFEIDLPDVLAFKDAVLSARRAVPRGQRTAVPADLRGDWTATLAEAGFDRSGPAAWLAEGLLLYLTRRGWLSRHHELAARAASYRRPVSGAARGGFLTAERRDPGSMSPQVNRCHG